jgi:threonine/homoserine/homoserine lactone efflux protein
MMTIPAQLTAIFAASFAVAFSGAMMPGPLLAAAIGEGSRRGFIAGPLLMVGHAALELILVAALLLGLSPYLARDEVFIAVSLLGGAILLWMAAAMFRSLPGLRMPVDGAAGRRGNLIFQGVLMSVSNPYWTIWWATVGLGAIMHSTQIGSAGVAAFYFGHILADFLWYGSVTFAVGKGKRFLSDRFYRGLVGCLAALMAVFAVYFIVSGFKKYGEPFTGRPTGVRPDSAVSFPASGRRGTAWE